MSDSLNVMAVVGSLQEKSITRVAVRHVADGLEAAGCTVDWLDLADHKLVAATRRIDIDLAATEYLLAILGREFHPGGSSPPDDPSQLSLVILECQVDVATFRPGQVG